MADLKDLEKTCYIFPLIELDLEDFPHQGLILDIAGGGEGVIGQLKGESVVSIDYKEEDFWNVVEKFANKDLVEKKNGVWRLKEPCT